MTMTAIDTAMQLLSYIPCTLGCRALLSPSSSKSTVSYQLTFNAFLETESSLVTDQRYQLQRTFTFFYWTIRFYMSQASEISLETSSVGESSQIHCQTYAPVFNSCYFNYHSRFWTDHTNSNNNHSTNYGLDPRLYPPSDHSPSVDTWLPSSTRTAFGPSTLLSCE